MNSNAETPSRIVPSIPAIFGEPLFVTFRLHDSLPPHLEFPARLPAAKAFASIQSPCRRGRYIQDKTVDHDGRIVAIGQLILFSTDAG